MNSVINSVLRAGVRALDAVIPMYMLLKPQRKDKHADSRYSFHLVPGKNNRKTGKI